MIPKNIRSVDSDEEVESEEERGGGEGKIYGEAVSHEMLTAVSGSWNPESPP
jgi:hypothetical protein